MNKLFHLILIALFTISACNNKKENKMTSLRENTTGSLHFEKGYAPVNGINMYYEIYGQGKPLVLIHGGGSTIQSNFEKVIPLFAKSRKVIAMELQAHGRTSDRNSPESFEQDADDVAGLLKHLAIGKADFLGFSNGGTTALQIAIRHPQLVNKMILGSALTKRNGVPAWFWDFMKNASLDNMPAQLKEAYLKVAANPAGLQAMHDKDAERMQQFKDIPDTLIKGIRSPVLVVIGDKDVIIHEHALELHKQLANSSLAIFPGVHGEYIGEVTTIKPGYRQYENTVPMLEAFLDQP